MPSHLHPRSRLTSSLFATTLFASFFVVVLPHALPCPAPRVAFADENGEMRIGGKRRRRRRECVSQDEETSERGKTLAEPRAVVDSEEGIAIEERGRDYTADGIRESRMKRECPVPKPGGFVGEMLGFRKVRIREESAGEGSKPP